MIIWDGLFDQSGGKYNPVMDSWTATSTTNAPSGRAIHTAVWTGSEMVVWGGYFFDGFSHYLNTGGRYNPQLNSWMATTTTDAPEGRVTHTALWSGSEMIVWGGNAESSILFHTPAVDTIPSQTPGWLRALSMRPTVAIITLQYGPERKVIVWGGISNRPIRAQVGNTARNPVQHPAPHRLLRLQRHRRRAQADVHPRQGRVLPPHRGPSL